MIHLGVGKRRPKALRPRVQCTLRCLFAVIHLGNGGAEIQCSIPISHQLDAKRTDAKQRILGMPMYSSASRLRHPTLRLTHLFSGLVGALLQWPRAWAQGAGIQRLDVSREIRYPHLAIVNVNSRGSPTPSSKHTIGDSYTQPKPHSWLHSHT